MRDQSAWSIPIGTFCGVQLRIHMFFLLFAAFTLYLCGLESGSGGEQWLGGVSLITLLGSVLAHELGHIITARLLGGDVTEVVLGPVGGLVTPRMPRRAFPQMVILLAGPAVNLLICVVVGIYLASARNVAILSLLPPFAPPGILQGSPADVVCKLVFWVNWFLLLVNLIPAYPFDGGRAMRAMLVAAVPTLRPEQAIRLVAVAAKAFAAALVLIAWFQGQDSSTHAVPVWFALSLLAIFIFFSARREEVQLERMRLELQESDQALAANEPDSVAVGVRKRIDAWRERRRAQEEAQRLQNDREEDVRVDEILARLHQSGINTLSPEEHALLQRASRRYRGRRPDSAN